MIDHDSKKGSNVMVYSPLRFLRSFVSWAILITPSIAFSQQIDRYDPNGRATGYTRDGSSFDTNGRLNERSSVDGHEQRFYDPNGRADGRAVSSGNSTRYYDNNGRIGGRAERDGATTRFYDPNGRPEGRMERDGNTERFYDQNGRLTQRDEIRK